MLSGVLISKYTRRYRAELNTGFYAEVQRGNSQFSANLAIYVMIDIPGGEH